MCVWIYEVFEGCMSVVMVENRFRIWLCVDNVFCVDDFIWYGWLNVVVDFGFKNLFLLVW